MNETTDDRSIFCTECTNRHKLTECDTKPFFNNDKSYFCPNVDDSKEIARGRGDRLVVWNGREFRS